jgi:hypothetical protein
MEDNFSWKVIPVLDRFSQARQNLVEQPQTMPTLTACVYLLLDLVFHAHEAHTVLQSEPLLNPNIDPYVTQMFNMTWEWVTRPRTSSELQCIVDMQCLCSIRKKVCNKLGRFVKYARFERRGDSLVCCPKLHGCLQISAMWHTAATNSTKSANRLLELQLSYKTCNYDTFSDISKFGKSDKFAYGVNHNTSIIS